MIGGTRVAVVASGEDEDVALPSSLLQAVRIEFERARSMPHTCSRPLSWSTVSS